jgi:hypothetical protein
MNLSARVLGANIVKELTERAASPLLIIGKDVFHRGDLAGVGCFNFMAAARLSRALTDIGVRDVRDVFENVPPTSLVLPQLGSISLSVLGAAFEARGLGGAQPLEAWVLKHRVDAKHPIVTFATLKASERKREALRATRRRSRARRSPARTL